MFDESSKTFWAKGAGGLTEDYINNVYGHPLEYFADKNNYVSAADYYTKVPYGELCGHDAECQVRLYFQTEYTIVSFSLVQL